MMMFQAEDYLKRLIRYLVSNKMLYNLLILIPILTLNYCKPKNYVTDKSQANVTMEAYLIFPHEYIELNFNGITILKDSNTIKPQGWFHYHKYFKLDMKDGDKVRFTTKYAGKVIIDTVVRVNGNYDKYFILLSAPYPKAIGLDSMKRIKIPYKYGYLPIEKAERIASVEPDTSREYVY